MLNLPGYKIIEHIYDYENAKFYRGYSVKDGRHVVIKTLGDIKMTPVEIFRLIHDYEFTRKLDIEGVIKALDIGHVGTVIVVIMEDVSAIPLRKYMENHQLSLEQFLHISIQLTKILSQIHQQGIIHRNLNPESILINPDLQKIYITDFRWAIIVSSTNKDKFISSNPVGSLEYMAQN